MAHIEICNVKKKFKKTIAIDDISLDIKDNEFFVLFGPAGAGKTTTLNIIAGIAFPDQGYVKIDGKIVNLLEPAKRNVSMVFENYALYPHLTVYDNIASPMRSPTFKKDEAYIKQEIERVTAILGISKLLDRLPKQLSNGQKQRVALGRCLVRKPNVFLMDEPLAHLDAKLRHFMRAELKEMQSNFNTTTIYVTHDYMEALSLGDRIGILNNGKIEQIGVGDDIFYRPANEFIAKMMGEPEINILEIELVQEAAKFGLRIFNMDKVFELPRDVEAAFRRKVPNDVDMGIRANDIEISISKKSDEYIHGTVYSIEPIGNKSVLIIAVNDIQIRTIVPNDFSAELDSDIYMKINYKNAIYFDRNTKAFIFRHENEDLSEKVI